MKDRDRPQYMNSDSTQTLREGLVEYYILNPNVTPPETQPAEFGKILYAHDVGHLESTLIFCPPPQMF
jgi:hypothetical protein